MVKAEGVDWGPEAGSSHSKPLLSAVRTATTFKDNSSNDFRVRDMMSSVQAFGSLIIPAIQARQVQELPGHPLLRTWPDRQGLNAPTPPRGGPAPEMVGCLGWSFHLTDRSAFPINPTVTSDVKASQYFVRMRAIA